MDKKILISFLKAGFLKDIELFETGEGFPQGSPISPVLANFALNGLTKFIEEGLRKSRFLFIRYADDFLVLGESEEDLKKIALPRVKMFLEQRGLKLNLTKTSITDISKGFDYLGYHFREYPDKTRVKGTKKGIFLVKPSQKNVIRFKRSLSELLRESRNKNINQIIQKLNEKIRGGLNIIGQSHLLKLSIRLGLIYFESAIECCVSGIENVILSGLKKNISPKLKIEIGFYVVRPKRKMAGTLLILSCFRFRMLKLLDTSSAKNTILLTLNMRNISYHELKLAQKEVLF